MAAGNFGSPLQLIILLAIIVFLFGGNRLRNLGGDIGNAIKGFKNAIADNERETIQKESSIEFQQPHALEKKIVNIQEHHKS